MKVHLYFILSAPISRNLRFMMHTCHSDGAPILLCVCFSVCPALRPVTPDAHQHPASPQSLLSVCLFFPGPWGRDLGSGPASPQPIRLTRPALKQTSAADIVLENPVETGWAPLLLLRSHLPNSDTPVNFMARDSLAQAWRFGNRKHCGFATGDNHRRHENVFEQKTVDAHATLRLRVTSAPSLPINLMHHRFIITLPPGEILIIPESSLGGCRTQSTGYLFLTLVADSSETLYCPGLWLHRLWSMEEKGKSSGRATSCRQDRAAGSRLNQNSCKAPQVSLVKTSPPPQSLCGSSSTGVGKLSDWWAIITSNSW